MPDTLESEEEIGGDAQRCEIRWQVDDLSMDRLMRDVAVGARAQDGSILIETVVTSANSLLIFCQD